jgi:hypothetical protein
VKDGILPIGYPVCFAILISIDLLHPEILALVFDKDFPGRAIQMIGEGMDMDRFNIGTLAEFLSLFTDMELQREVSVCREFLETRRGTLRVRIPGRKGAYRELVFRIERCHPFGVFGRLDPGTAREEANQAE